MKVRRGKGEELAREEVRILLPTVCTTPKQLAYWYLGRVVAWGRRK
jgi:hypothetical protein